MAATKVSLSCVWHFASDFVYGFLIFFTDVLFRYLFERGELERIQKISF